MADFPKKGFSPSDPDDEIDLEALVQKAPSPPQQQKVQPLQPPRQEKPVRAASSEEEFDLATVGKAPKNIEAPSKPAAPKDQQPVETVKHAHAESYAVDAETEYDHPVPRKKVRILPEFPTLILIIIVSIVTAVITGIIVRYTMPSLENKVAEVYSNQENTSVKLNDLEQSVSKLLDEVKTMREKAKPQPPASSAPAKKVKAKAKAATEPEGGPGLQGESSAPAGTE